MKFKKNRSLLKYGTFLSFFNLSDLDLNIMDEDNLSLEMGKMLHVCPPRLTLCDKCGRYPTSGKYSCVYPWLVNVCCDDCGIDWLVCRLCSHGRTAMTLKKVAGHHKRKHMEMNMNEIHANSDVAPAGTEI